MTRTKYGAKAYTLDGIRFASKREANRWAELKLFEMAGEIADLERQVPIVLLGANGPILTDTGRPRRYIADFTYLDGLTGALCTEDAKGYPTPEYKLKRAILAAQGIAIREV